jgi:hypothetical protein
MIFFIVVIITIIIVIIITINIIIILILFHLFSPLSSPDMSVLAFTSTDPTVNIYVVADVVKAESGFNLERQQLPPSLHTTIMPKHFYIVDELIQAIKKGVETARKNPSLANKGECCKFVVITAVSFLLLLVVVMWCRWS